jgi:hypothetical protein
MFAAPEPSQKQQACDGSGGLGRVGNNVIFPAERCTGMIHGGWLEANVNVVVERLL